MSEQLMSLVERLRNPAWESGGEGEPARLNIEQTREAMEEAADVIGLIWAVIGDAARHRTLAEAKP